MRCLILFLSAGLFAQESVVLKNTGDSMRVDFACNPADLEWAGLACSAEEPCPIYLELSSVVPIGKKLITAGNLHSTSGTIFSILLLSNDGGLTWKEPAKRIRGASLDQLQFYDFQSGWAAGEVLYPLPRDPFFLLSTDGGDSWQQRPVTDEGGPGNIHRFWFDTAQHGELIVDRGKAGGADRYSQYDSETGGEGWNIKGTASKLPAIRKAPIDLEHPDWRLRTSKDKSSYQIERREGERWVSASAFLIHPVDCKTTEVELKEPDAVKSEEEKKDFVEMMTLPGGKVDPKKAKKKK